jgi:hypothetical protein
VPNRNINVDEEIGKAVDLVHSCMFDSKVHDSVELKGQSNVDPFRFRTPSQKVDQRLVESEREQVQCYIKVKQYGDAELLMMVQFPYMRSRSCQIRSFACFFRHFKGIDHQG